MGGHDVPAQIVRRRFWKTLVNFDRLYRPLATTWRLYDGSVLGGRPLIAHGSGADRSTIVDETKWTEIRRRIEEIA
jgi:predicted ABC-type ATPase